MVGAKSAAHDPRHKNRRERQAGGPRHDAALSRPDHHILYLHGGAYIYGSPLLYRDLSWRIADAARAVVWMLDYRLAPEHPFPAALDDAACAYRWLLAQGADPRRIAVMGDSAGGGLTFGTLLKLRDEGEPMPAAAAGLSPWTDLTITSASSRLFAKTDPMLNLGDVKHYVPGIWATRDRRNPYASPVFGDPAGLPPSLIQAGDDEMLRDDAVTMAERLQAAGVPAELDFGRACRTSGTCWRAWCRRVSGRSSGLACLCSNNGHEARHNRPALALPSPALKLQP